MDLLKAFQRTIGYGDRVLDIGAFKGNFSVLFSQLVGEGGKVFAFEPHPMHFFELSIKAERVPFRNIFPYNKALCDSVGHTTLFFDMTRNDSEASTIVSALANTERLGQDFCGCFVETDTLDGFCDGHNIKPDFLKIDVEGAEAQVIKGGQTTVARFLPIIVFECGFGDDSSPDYPFLLEELGYELFIVDVMHYMGDWVKEGSPYRSTALLPIATREFPLFSQILVNLLAIPKTKINNLSIMSEIHKMRAVDYFRLMTIL